MNDHSIPVGSLCFLWHPGTADVFSGYGLTLQPDSLEQLVGLLLVDRPHVVDPDWLAEVERRFGGYTLHAMTATEERGIACQMWVERESQAYLRRLGIVQAALGVLITRALTPFLWHLPKPRLNVSWDETLRLWVSELMDSPNSLRGEL
jgi:hypothetical protein